VEDFCRKHLAGPKKARNVQLLIEELLMAQLLPQLSDEDIDVQVLIRARENDESAELSLCWGGPPLDIAEEREETELSWRIVKRLTCEQAYGYDAQERLANRFTALLK
jgi:hypothetical protein